MNKTRQQGAHINALKVQRLISWRSTCMVLCQLSNGGTNAQACQWPSNAYRSGGNQLARAPSGTQNRRTEIAPGQRMCTPAQADDTLESLAMMWGATMQRPPRLALNLAKSSTTQCRLNLPCSLPDASLPRHMSLRQRPDTHLLKTQSQKAKSPRARCEARG